MEEEFDPKPYYAAVRKFYITSITKMLNKFPFGNSILKDLGIINPEKTCTYSFSTIESLAKRFPQLDLADSESINALRDQFMDFKLSPAEHPAISVYRSATGDEKPRAGKFWNEVGKLKTFDGEPRFHC